MLKSAFFSIIYWDPNPTLFTLPYINHPLKWYGLLFMGGIAAGFLILLPLLRQKLLQSHQLRERDISNWIALQKAMREATEDPINPLHSIATTLDKKTYHLLEQNKELPDANKTALLTTLSSMDRKQLEKLLPKTIIPLNELTFKYVDGLMWWIVIGTVVGARLGHVFFYDWTHYQRNLVDILKVWEGGLASHGGTIGVVLAIYLYSRRHREKFPELSFLALSDLLSIPVAFAVIFIRLGNFVNQEILGTPSFVPWAVVFGHPADGTVPVPRHPVQLYEAIAYFLTFLLLTTLWKFKKGILTEGLYTGIFFICVFGSRFFLEFFKATQSSQLLDGGFLQAGQILSLPFVAFGVLLICWSHRGSCNIRKKQNFERFSK
jgi:prolipoprotein diacylglyceryl transferase